MRSRKAPEAVADAAPEPRPSGPPQILVASGVLEYLLECSDKHIRNLADRSVVVRASRGQYDLVESLRNYIALETMPRSKNGKKAIGLDLEEIEKAKAFEDLEEKRMKNERTRANLIPREQIAPFFMEIVANFRQALLDNHGKATPTLTSAAKKGGEKALAVELKRVDDEILSELNRTLTLDDPIPSDADTAAEDAGSDAGATA